MYTPGLKPGQVIHVKELTFCAGQPGKIQVITISGLRDSIDCSIRVFQSYGRVQKKLM